MMKLNTGNQSSDVMQQAIHMLTLWKVGHGY